MNLLIVTGSLWPASAPERENATHLWYENHPFLQFVLQRKRQDFVYGIQRMLLDVVPDVYTPAQHFRLYVRILFGLASPVAKNVRVECHDVAQPDVDLLHRESHHGQHPGK